MNEKPPFKRLLVANRGEIAIRILRAATELGIRTVAIYSHEDRFALYRFKADEAYKIGQEDDPIGTYLDAENIVKKSVEWNVDAIHPGYGFLSESSHFARLCKEAGIKFIGPNADTLDMFGDKVSARTAAEKAGLPVIPGSQEPLKDLNEAKQLAKKMGYPVTLKAVSGGGGKGIRMIDSEQDLATAFSRAQSEAKTSFGRADIYLEKTIEAPKHIEVQIMGDEHGHIVHLFERDCSIQRRHQKVVEVAPALGISKGVRKRLHDYALRIARHCQYSCLGTVEFLVDKNEEIYFLEVNPRIQVEHTVTEMITGVDLVQASILIASGEKLDHPLLGVKDQEHIWAKGAAIQCRVTTEDPLNQFAPDTGEIIAYRPAAGFGIRLDEGTGTAGGVITPHYDSLLVKITAYAQTIEAASAKMHRSLSEFRIRGVKHNIPLLKKVVRHPVFLEQKMTTHFFDRSPELFELQQPRDRATRLLRYIADVTVNNPHGLSSKDPKGEMDAPDLDYTVQPWQKGAVREKNAKAVFDQDGVEGLKRWIRQRQPLLLTDTTMRDAHQSLFATRLRTRDILKAAPYYAQFGSPFFSLEVWGGATFDTSLRFLKECPWDRLAQIREAIPNQLLQMLLRGDNAVGYTNYPAWVVRDFIRLTAETGLDVFRIFDCLNQPSKMKVAIEEVKKNGAICEVCLCYTGNLTDPAETKYTLAYYLNVAKELAAMGADILCIKDMAGLLRPKAAEVLIKALRETIDLPIHLHTHDTSGAGVAMLLVAAGAGCDIVDGAVSSMSGLTSQPSMNALVSALGGDPRCPEVPLATLDELGRYWEGVRSMYQDFDPGIKATSTDVYIHEIPGGQYSNLYEQARKVGVSSKDFYELTQRYRDVNDLFGNLIKVTPSSKVVGDMALLMQKQGLTGDTFLKEKPQLDYPDSVVSFFKGHMGTPYGGFPEKVRALVLGDDPPEPASAPLEKDDDFDSVAEELAKKLGYKPLKKDVLSYRLYPKVFKDYMAHRKKYGVVRGLTTPVFFYGLKQGVEIETDIEKGKTLVISLNGISEPDAQGVRTVFFDLNGFPRAIDVIDESVAATTVSRQKADPHNEAQIGASMPGKVLEIRVKIGDQVKAGDQLAVTESMKMEYVITAKRDGSVRTLPISPGDVVETGDLLVELGDA